RRSHGTDHVPSAVSRGSGRLATSVPPAVPNGRGPRAVGRLRPADQGDRGAARVSRRLLLQPTVPAACGRPPRAISPVAAGRARRAVTRRAGPEQSAPPPVPWTAVAGYLHARDQAVRRRDSDVRFGVL